MRQKAYAAAGVDIDLGNRVKATLPQLLASTHRREVLGKVGGFGGLFALDTKKFRQPVLVSSADGVGTKLKLAFAMDRHDTVGQDLVNHCVNDIAVMGAEPLFFLDYIGTGRLQPRVFRELIGGFAQACAHNNCALIGGETAQMPGFYREGEYDVSGTIVGVVEKSRLLDGKRIRSGDAVIGLASSGLHTNGYSLARKLFFEVARYTPDQYVNELREKAGVALMKTHRSYLNIIRKLTAADLVVGMAHVTGGGITENLPRILPKNVSAAVELGSWTVLPIFDHLRMLGNVEQEEMLRTFNMGIGLICVVQPEKYKRMKSLLDRASEPHAVIGKVTKGDRRVLYN